MELLFDGLTEAWRLLTSFDPKVVRIALLTIEVSGLATLLALAIGVPVGTWLAFGRFRGRRAAVGAVNAGMGMPPVVVGLVVSILLWRSGVLGVLGLIYTPVAMIVAQVVIALPVVIGLTVAAMQQIDPALRLQIRALGASRWQSLLLLMQEAKLALLAAAMAGFGAAISEVGASMMVGGNIAGHTRVLTTATVLEVSKGKFEMAIALSVALVLIIVIVNMILTRSQQRAVRRIG
ncbi:MAG TPA: ABC transporter permease [Chloroflexota bacterium]|nr:ABC transporter permease [Chloroflexota bacterium]